MCLREEGKTCNAQGLRALADLPEDPIQFPAHT